MKIKQQFRELFLNDLKENLQQIILTKFLAAEDIVEIIIGYKKTCLNYVSESVIKNNLSKDDAMAFKYALAEAIKEFGDYCKNEYSISVSNIDSLADCIPLFDKLVNQDSEEYFLNTADNISNLQNQSDQSTPSLGNNMEEDTNI